MSILIEEVDTRTAPLSVLEELAAYHPILEAEELPDDPPTPAANLIAEWRNQREHYASKRWVLREDGDIVAFARANYDLEQNLENGFGRVHVHPERRGNGYAHAIAVPMLDDLETAGRTRFATWITRGHPGGKELESLGLKKVFQDKRSRLLIPDLDLDLMSSWVARAVERAADYELVHYLLPLPDEVIQKFCDLSFVMNSAPLDDFEFEDEVLTPEEWRDTERAVLGAQCRLHNLIAVHKPTGEWAGFTQILAQDLQPDLAWQWNTGVHPDHRNKGLGRWLKADMIQRLVAEYPRVERIDTENAASNEPMLNINVAMGFKPIHVAVTYQGSLATVRERLGV